VVVGAILTQHTAWANAKRAIERLEAVGRLNWEGLRDATEAELAERIRPAGAFRVKARHLKAFVEFLWTHHGGDLDAALSGPLEEARRRLLAVRGIGPETADAILLYAGNRPTFVVDAYTKRILRRHGLIQADADDPSVRALFHAALPRNVRLFNEYHALLVAVGKKHCGTVARCDGCPLADLPHDGSR
jgi:endonuclease-3 related protein